MNKGDLVDKIAELSKLKKADAAAALNATLDALKDALKTGEKITLVGFGTFDVSYRAARKGINPATQAEIKIDDKVTVKFKPGKELSTAVDSKDLRASMEKAGKEKAAAKAAPKKEEKKTTTTKGKAKK